jgi:CRP-like cAMP-binding protein
MVLVSGAADVRKNGRRINRLGPGDFLGEIALLSGSPRTATVVTTEPSEILVLTHRAFDRVVKEIPSLRASLLAALSERLQATSL